MDIVCYLYYDLYLRMKPPAALEGREWDQRKQAEESDKAHVISLKLGDHSSRDYFFNYYYFG